MLLVERGFAASRERAQAAIMAGLVTVSGRPVAKPGALVAAEAEIAVAAVPRFVGRGGEKLDGLLDAIALDVRGLATLDVGASTGGFTDCLLQRGAASVVALDVGRGQLDWKLRNDPRVRVVEGINVRYLDPSTLPHTVDLIVVDVSFISLTLVLPVLFPLLKLPREAHAHQPRGETEERATGRSGSVERPVGGEETAAASNASPTARATTPSTEQILAPPKAGAGPAGPVGLPALLALVKPQFEVGRGLVGRGGIVRNPEHQIGSILKVASGPDFPGIAVRRILESPIRGAEGNREFFLCFG